MGQDISHLSLDRELQPGTYRVVSALAGTAIQVSTTNHAKAEAWARHDGENQRWFLQRSGEGYRFKNCQYGSYLAVSSTNNFSQVYAGRYPTTWVLLKSGDCYVIEYGDNNKVLDLHRGSAANGNQIHIWPADGQNMGNKTWKLERLSDNAGEELPGQFQKVGARLQRDLDAKIGMLARNELELAECRNVIAEKDKEITRINDALAKKEEELSKQRDLLSEYENTIRQLRRDLEPKGEAPTQANKPNEETAYLRNQQAHLQNKLSQQQTETASLQAKMDRFEYLMSQMMNKGSGTHDKLP